MDILGVVANGANATVATNSDKPTGAVRWPGQDIEEHVDAGTARHRTVIVAAHNDVPGKLFGLRPPDSQIVVDPLSSPRRTAAAGSDRSHPTTSKRACA